MERDTLVASLLAVQIANHGFAARTRGDLGPPDALAAAVAGFGWRLAAPASARRIAADSFQSTQSDDSLLLDVLGTTIFDIETIAAQDATDDERSALDRVHAAFAHLTEANRAASTLDVVLALADLTAATERLIVIDAARCRKRERS